LNKDDIKYARSLITDQMRDEFDKRGWIKIDLKIDTDLVKNVQTDLRRARVRAIKTHYPARRIYFDHLFDANIAAIELPFNDLFCPNSLKNFYKITRIGTLVRYLMGWESTSNTLTRLFTMGNYKYRGQWHRDYKLKNNTLSHSSIRKTSVQAGIYFEEQEGFRILKKMFERGGDHSVFEKKDNNDHIESTVASIPLPLKIHRDMYDVIHGDPGTIILFDPSLYHQGSCQNSRLDIHMRFQKTSEIDVDLTQNPFLDFDCIHYLGHNFPLRDLNKIKIPANPRQSLKRRLINSINYYIPLYNLYMACRDRSKIAKLPPDFSPDLLSNTLYQAD
jgi:hypothetical protein